MHPSDCPCTLCALYPFRAKSELAYHSDTPNTTRKQHSVERRSPANGSGGVRVPPDPPSVSSTQRTSIQGVWQ